MFRSQFRSRFSLLAVLAAALFLTACLVDDDGNGEEGEGDASLALITEYTGTYAVDSTLEGETHARGTVLVGEDGAIDFDTGLAFTAEDYLGVYNRLDVDHPPYGPRIQIEIHPEGDLPQRRIRFFVDVAAEMVTHIAYYPDAASETATVVRVTLEGSEE